MIRWDKSPAKPPLRWPYFSNVRTFSDYRFQGLEKLAPRVLNLHVFHWLFHPMKGGWGENIDRRPLEEGAADWKRYLSVNLSPGDHYALMEFVRDDSEDRFKQDAAVLRRLLD